MLSIIAFVLIALWLIGMASAYTMGGLLHVLLVLAVMFLLVKIIRDRRSKIKER